MDQLPEQSIINKKNYKYKTNFNTPKQYESDYDHKSMLITGEDKSQIYGKKLKLVSQPNYQQQLKKQKKLLYSYQYRQPQEDISTVKKQVEKLQYELSLREKLQTYSKNKYQIKNSYSRPYKMNTLQNSYENYPQPETGKIKRKFFKRQDLLWEPPYNQSSLIPYKKLYKIKPKRRRYLSYGNYGSSEEEENQIETVIDRITPLNRSRQRIKDLYLQPDDNLIPKLRHPLKISRFLKSTRLNRLFKKAVHVVLFTIRLRTFNERMRIKRFGFFQKFIREQQLSQKLLQLKKELILYSKPLFRTIIDHQNFNYRLLEQDEPILKREKINSVKKLVNLEIKNIQKCVREMQNRHQFSELIYLLCKHGNYSCVEELNTNQEFNLLCVSQFYGYSRSDKYLEQSAIISLVFIKMLLFNILLQPDKIEMVVSSNVNLKVIFGNVKLIGNILYQLLIDIQDILLQKAPAIYSIGNWYKLKSRFKFKISQSMTLRQGFYQKNELVSGLASHKYIQDIYKTKLMIDQKHILTQLVRTIHQQIINYHEDFRKQTFII